MDDIDDMSHGHVMCCGFMIWHKRKHVQDSEVLLRQNLLTCSLSLSLTHTHTLSVSVSVSVSVSINMYIKTFTTHTHTQTHTAFSHAEPVCMMMCVKFTHTFTHTQILLRQNLPPAAAGGEHDSGEPGAARAERGGEEGPGRGGDGGKAGGSTETKDLQKKVDLLSEQVGMLDKDNFYYKQSNTNLKRRLRELSAVAQQGAGCVCARVRACVCVCARASVRACICACIRA